VIIGTTSKQANKQPNHVDLQDWPVPSRRLRIIIISEW
jgi:hypothetical protein